MKLSRILFTGAMLAGAMSGTALAAPAYVSSTVYLRAGPGVQYPIVDKLRTGTRLDLVGCLNRRDWCEVELGDNYGWVSSGYLQVYRHKKRVRFVEAPPAAVPVITFEISNYWDEHYRDKPFYRERGKWAHGDRGRRGHDDDRDHDRGHGNDYKLRRDHEPVEKDRWGGPH